MSAEIRVLKTEYGDILQIRIPKTDGNVLKKDWMISKILKQKYP